MMSSFGSSVGSLSINLSISSSSSQFSSISVDADVPSKFIISIILLFWKSGLTRFGGCVRIEIASKHLKPYFIVFGRLGEVATSPLLLYRVQFSDPFIQGKR